MLESRVLKMKGIMLFSFILIQSFQFSMAQLPDEIRKTLENHPKVLSLDYEEEFFRNGNIKAEGYYFDTQYYPFTSVVELKDTVSMKVGIWKYYYKNGELRAMEDIPLFEDSALINKVLFNRKGEKIGFRRHCFLDEILPIEELKAGNSKVRLKKYYFIRFYNNGNVKWESTMAKFIPIGEYKSFYKNGRMKKLVHYNDESTRDGVFKVWFSNGAIKIIGKYEEGSKTGTWEKYNKEGKLIKRKKYES